MREHLEVSIVAYTDRLGLDSLETSVLDLLDPTLNLAKRPSTLARQRLPQLRRAYTGEPLRLNASLPRTRAQGRLAAAAPVREGKVA
jgi:hypothetical protein